MEFTESQLEMMKGRILLISKFPNEEGLTEKIKGRLTGWDDKSLILSGDVDVTNELVPPDDLAAQQTGTSLRRLMEGEQVRVLLESARSLRRTE